MGIGAPSGTVTFLFTDIEDSTRLWESTPADMTAAVQAHDVIVRSAIERHGGHVFATGGDGFCVAFSSAVDAVTAAVESQRELGGDDAIPFAVRMALHTGEAIERDHNYYGTEVNRAARLMALAHGGQVLVSDTAEVLVRSRVALRPLGDHLLRGLRGTIPVFQVMADGLPSEFPVLRSVDDFAGNLPRQVSSLVGRDAEVDDVAELVRSQRLVTLTGVGGVGKTRLAIEVGAELAGEFDDGVWIVELAGVGDPGAVPAALATVLGITPQGDVPLIDTVADTVAGRRHAARRRQLRAPTGSGRRRDRGDPRASWAHEDPGDLARGRSACPASRSTTVSPLATEGGVTSDAVTLFVERARSARHDFELQDPQTAAAVTEICETVDGLPLGIELAAARMAAMSAIEVRDRLADRFRLLQRGAPGPERQLTLRHAVEWSYDLLTDDERSLLRTASVFAGGFDLSSICAVVDDADEIDVLRHLDSLVRKSLVVADHSAATTRYGLYETIRQFAEDRLADAGERERGRETSTPRTSGAGPSRSGNGGTGPGGATPSTGWSSSSATSGPDSGGAPSAARWRWRPTSPRTPRSWASRCSCSRRSPGPRSCSTRRRRPTCLDSPACTRRPAMRASPGGPTRPVGTPTGPPNWRPTIATTRASRATRCSSKRSVRCTAATSTATSSSPARWRERYGAERGYGLASYVDGLQSAGRVEEALALTEQSVAAARELGNPYWIAYALWIAGMAFSRSDSRRALAAWDEGVAFVREHRVHFFEGFLARDAARLHTSDGEPEAALVLFGDAIASFHRAGNVPQLIITLASVPALFERLERFEAAATLLGAMSRHESSFHHVPELADLEGRLAAKLEAKRTKELVAEGAALRPRRRRRVRPPADRRRPA